VTPVVIPPTPNNTGVMLNIFQTLWPLTLFHLCLAAVGTSQEIFTEKLSLKTLQDGKVASTFTFTTLLKDAIPRDPRKLDEEDTCT